MLNELHIENIAVIERADIRFTKGMNVMTGETGAGKSIVIDAIGAVLGGRVSRELVRHGAEKALVSASFDCAEAADWLRENEIDAENELIIQRRINADGKSSCRVCGIPVTAAQLKELGAHLVDVHGQNDGRLLMDEKLHLGYLDRFGSYQNELERYAREYSAYRRLRREIGELQMDEIEKARISDSLRYQIAELERAELKEGEMAEVEARLELLRHSEKLTESIGEAYRSLYGGDDNAVTMAQNAAYYAQRAAAITSELEGAAKAIGDAAFMLTDAAEQLRDFQDSLDFSPEEFDRLEGRMSLFRKLERKYNKEIDELPDYLDACRKKLEDIESSDDKLLKLKQELAAQTARCRSTGEVLSKKRRETAVVLQKRIVSELRDLSMPSVRFEVEFHPITDGQGFDVNGIDEIRFVMSANAGEELGRISKIASGGELSRIMLAMKNVFAENDPVDTMIFDEIDTGVSGIAAQRVGEKLFSVSSGKQVLCVTHLPQIAAMADSHFVIAKQERDGRTYTEVNLLDREGRKRELARLYGGDNVTETTLAGAEEQLSAAEHFKSAFSAKHLT